DRQVVAWRRVRGRRRGIDRFRRARIDRRLGQYVIAEHDVLIVAAFGTSQPSLVRGGTPVRVGLGLVFLTREVVFLQFATIFGHGGPRRCRRRPPPALRRPGSPPPRLTRAAGRPHPPATHAQRTGPRLVCSPCRVNLTRGCPSRKNTPRYARESSLYRLRRLPVRSRCRCAPRDRSAPGRNRCRT